MFLAILFVIYAESGLINRIRISRRQPTVHRGIYGSAKHTTSRILPFNIHIFVAMLFIAAVLGDSTGYAFGHRVGRKLFDCPNSRFFKKKYLVQAEKFYEKHGALTIVLARFVPIIRTFAPIVAGTSKMHYRTFLFFNLIGAALWTASFTYLGYFAGAALTKAGINIEVAAIIIILLSISPMIIHALKQKRNSHFDS